MARPTAPKKVSGNQAPTTMSTTLPTPTPAMAASAAVFHPGKKVDPKTDRTQIAKPWQVEVYRHVNICGEARYAATLFANLAARAEIGVSEPQALARKAVWVTEGPEVEAFAELVPSVRDRSKLIRDYMLHYTIAGECYLIARTRQPNDPGYVAPPEGYDDWDTYLTETARQVDLYNDGAPGGTTNPNVENPIWEVVAVTEIQKVGETWRVRYDNGNYINLDKDDPVIRMWNPDPEDRREAWSPFRSLLPTLMEIEWLTKHIFTQVRSRLMSAGVWFLPDNLTFPPPPPDAVEGGAEAIAQMNEAEQFMVSLASSGMGLLDGDDVAFPSVVMADPTALANIDQAKLIQFWSEIDDKAMLLRSAAVQRFALGMDMPPETLLGASGLAVTNSGGSAGSVNHWGVWANEEQAISDHVEPALDTLVSILTTAYLQASVEGTVKVIGYDTASLRLRQDRSKEAMEWYDRGVLKAEVALRETGFDPTSDIMSIDEHRTWLLNKLVSGSPSPEQMQAAFLLLTGKELPVEVLVSGNEGADTAPRGIAGPDQPPSLEDHPYEGPPREQHDHSDAPFSGREGVAEVLVLRALEKAGNRLLNNGKRGRDRDRTTPAHLAHLSHAPEVPFGASDFDFSLASTALGDLPAAQRATIEARLARYCAHLYATGTAYDRRSMVGWMRGL